MSKTKKRLTEEVLDRKYYLDKITKLPTSELQEIWSLWCSPTAEQIIDELKRESEK